MARSNSSNVSNQIETEQRFLVDVDEWQQHLHRAYALTSIRQCYVAVTSGGVGAEVRFREVTHIDPPSATPRYTQTIKRNRSGIARDELEWDVDTAVFDAVWASTPWRLTKQRYKIECCAVPRPWDVDVFTSGPLLGIGVAEMELPEGCAGVADYMASLGATQWPAWLAMSQGSHIDLTDEMVNYVAAGTVGLSGYFGAVLSWQRRQREAAATKRRRQAIAQTRLPYDTAPRSRQGVVDLDTVARRAAQMRRGVGDVAAATRRGRGDGVSS